MDAERSGASSAKAEDAEQLEDAGRQLGFFARILGLSNDDDPADDAARAEAAAEAAATANERAMMSNIRALRDQRVEDIMIPRADILSVDEAATLEELAEVFREGAHSRLPVYRETLDDPVGFIHVKDVALALGFGAPAEPFEMKHFVRQMLVVPPSMPTGRLMQLMQKRRIHMALVVDEYGGVDGLVTIEDLVEQIVGDIEDEHDEAEAAAWRAERPGVYVANARAELSDFEADVGVDLLPDEVDEDVDTLGGLVFMLANRIPERGEVIAHPDGHEFEVIDADPRRIKRLRVSLNGAERLAARPAE